MMPDQLGQIHHDCSASLDRILNAEPWQHTGKDKEAVIDRPIIKSADSRNGRREHDGVYTD